MGSNRQKYRDLKKNKVEDAAKFKVKFDASMTILEIAAEVIINLVAPKTKKVKIFFVFVVKLKLYKFE